MTPDLHDQYGTKFEDEAYAPDWWAVAGWLGAFIVCTAFWYLAFRIGQFLWR